MPAVEAHLRVRHPCPYCDLSVEFPSTLLLLWCDNRRDVFLVAAPDPEELERVLAALRDAFRARTLVREGNDALVVVPDFEWADPPSVTGLARQGGVWTLPPVVYLEGRETYRFLSPTKRELYALIARLRRLGEVELLAVSTRSGLSRLKDLPMESTTSALGLTDRQTSSLVAAFEGGLLSVPARAGWSEVARRIGLSRSTFGEHLRKGQLRLLENCYPALRARIRESGVATILPPTRPVPGPRRAPLRGTREP